MNTCDGVGSGRFRVGRGGSRLVAVLAVVLLAAGLAAGVGAPAARASCGNPIACENALPGTPESVWDAGGIRYKASGSPWIKLRCPACGSVAVRQLTRQHHLD